MLRRRVALPALLLWVPMLIAVIGCTTEQGVVRNRVDQSVSASEEAAAEPMLFEEDP